MCFVTEVNETRGCRRIQEDMPPMPVFFTYPLFLVFSTGLIGSSTRFSCVYGTTCLDRQSSKIPVCVAVPVCVHLPCEQRNWSCSCTLIAMLKPQAKQTRVGDCFGISDLYQSNPQLVFVLPVAETVMYN